MAKYDFSFKETSLAANQTKLEAAINLIKSQDTISNYFETDLIQNAFTYIYSFTNANFGRPDALVTCEFFTKNDFHNVVKNLTEYYSENSSSLSEEDANVQQIRIKERKFEILDLAQSILNFLLGYSVKFRFDYFQAGGLKCLLDLIQKEECVKAFINRYLFSNLMSNITLLSRDVDTFKSEWNDLNAVDILLKLVKDYPKWKLQSYIVLANIATDKQISTLPDIHEILANDSGMLKRAADAFKSNMSIKREKIQFNEEDEEQPQQHEVYNVTDRDNPNKRTTLTGLLNTLYKVAVNDKIKYDLFVKYNVKDSLRIIILKGVNIEKKYALKLLAQLCFDPQVNDMVTKDKELVKFIETMSNNTKCTMKSLLKVCKQVMWSLNIKKNVKDVLETSNKPTAVNQVKNEQKIQLMISYNSASRDLCLKIKNELEKTGYKTWIDIDEIHGSSLESMARAVETSDIILMCVTEKYRQSINCQAEAQYAFKLKKPIIPLIMQKGYENVDGWLGMIMGDKIYISFIKYAFDESISKLMSQIGLLTHNNQVPVLSPPPPPPLPIKTETENLNEVITKTTVIPLRAVNANINSEEDVAKWSEERVEKWFNEINQKLILDLMKPCDGKLLYQLYKMQTSAPEFFYQSISNDKKVDLRQILLFTDRLGALFKKS